MRGREAARLSLATAKARCSAGVDGSMDRSEIGGTEEESEGGGWTVQVAVLYMKGPEPAELTWKAEDEVIKGRVSVELELELEGEISTRNEGLN